MSSQHTTARCRGASLDHAAGIAAAAAAAAAPLEWLAAAQVPKDDFSAFWASNQKRKVPSDSPRFGSLASGRLKLASAGWKS
eukprot:4922868-Prymnesium_polylepis.1